jgi:hypothetical protein
VPDRKNGHVSPKELLFADRFKPCRVGLPFKVYIILELLAVTPEL